MICHIEWYGLYSPLPPWYGYNIYAYGQFSHKLELAYHGMNGHMPFICQADINNVKWLFTGSFAITFTLP